jgi:hypothetical protein
MAHIDKVERSIETDDGGRCVDIFRRPDGSFGFEEYRRDVEDGHGWFPIGFFAARTHATTDEALQDALTKVPWLASVLTK